MAPRRQPSYNIRPHGVLAPGGPKGAVILRPAGPMGAGLTCGLAAPIMVVILGITSRILFLYDSLTGKSYAGSSERHSPSSVLPHTSQA